MRDDILLWNRKKNGSHWALFLKLLEIAPISDDEYNFILEKEVENKAKNFIRHSESHFNPVRKCLNSIYFKERALNKDLTKIDYKFLNENPINFKGFLKRIENHPMSLATFNQLITNSNTTGDFNENKKNHIKVSRDILLIANRLHSIESLNLYNDKKSIQEVAYELEKEVLESLTLAPKIRSDALKKHPKIPEKIRFITTGFKRNPHVIAEVLLRAKGICEKCSKPAPFIRKKDNTPYLEVHHKTMLSDGGEDTVENAIALCPNCHRQQHFSL
jgi:hypothetical protein